MLAVLGHMLVKFGQHRQRFGQHRMIWSIWGGGRLLPEQLFDNSWRAFWKTEELAEIAKGKISGRVR